MGDEFYGAKLVASYSISVEAKMSDPSQQVQQIYDIQPQKFFVLEGTDRVFPQNVLPTAKKFMGLPGIGEVGWHEPVQPVVGQVYPVHLSYVFLSLAAEYRKKEPKRFLEGTLFANFKPGELEERIKAGKADFLKILQEAELNPDESQIHIDLGGHLG